MHSTFKTTFSALLAAGLALAACQSDPGPGSPAISPTDVPDAPSGSGEGEDDRATTPDAGEPPGDCQLGSHWDRAPTTSCSASTGACIAKATTGAAASACITADENCSTCFSDSVQGCLVGTPGKPGPCASQAGCVDGCVVGVCALVNRLPVRNLGLSDRLPDVRCPIVLVV